MIPFSDEEIYHAVKNHLPEVVQYVNSHGGDIDYWGSKMVMSISNSPVPVMVAR